MKKRKTARLLRISLLRRSRCQTPTAIDRVTYATHQRSKEEAVTTPPEENQHAFAAGSPLRRKAASRTSPAYDDFLRAVRLTRKNSTAAADLSLQRHMARATKKAPPEEAEQQQSGVAQPGGGEGAMVSLFLLTASSPMFLLFACCVSPPAADDSKTSSAEKLGKHKSGDPPR
nr:hypothetical protein Iba_chr04bCG10260 [Ipomoea batatas]GMC95870.1 hypothetical protein Iba_chr05cCG12740 [Ipomoea batatas]